MLGLFKDKSMTWTYVSPKSVKTDFFGEEVGPKGTCYEEGKEPPIKVLRGYTYRNVEGDILRAFLMLYPGNINADVLKSARQGCRRISQLFSSHHSSPLSKH